MTLCNKVTKRQLIPVLAVQYALNAPLVRKKTMMCAYWSMCAYWKQYTNLIVKWKNISYTLPSPLSCLKRICYMYYLLMYTNRNPLINMAVLMVLTRFYLDEFFFNLFA